MLLLSLKYLLTKVSVLEILTKTKAEKGTELTKLTCSDILAKTTSQPRPKG